MSSNPIVSHPKEINRNAPGAIKNRVRALKKLIKQQMTIADLKAIEKRLDQQLQDLRDMNEGRIDPFDYRAKQITKTNQDMDPR